MQLARGREAGRGVQAAGLIEHALVRGQSFGQRPQRARGDARARAHRCAAHLDLVERGLAADAARRVGQVAALAQVVGNRPPQSHGHDVVLLLRTLTSLGGQAVRDGLHVVGGGDEPLGAAESDRELEVVAGRAHRDRERSRLLTRAVHADLHRLLGRELIAPRGRNSVVDRQHLRT